MAYGTNSKTPKAQNIIRNYCPAVLSLLLICVSTFVETTPKAVANTCKVVARVIEPINRDYPVGHPFCGNQTIPIPSPIFVACLATRQVVLVKNSLDLNRCSVAPQFGRACTPQSQAFCSRTRSPELVNKPTLLNPYGVTLRPVSTEFTWMQVEGADLYNIGVDSVSGRMSVYSTRDTKTNLTLPAGTVSVVVQAMRQGVVIGSSVTTFNVLSESASLQLAQQTKTVQSLRVLPTEKVLVILSILAQKGLISEQISFLEKQHLGESAVLTRTQADVYREAGLMDKALGAYQKAQALAQQSSDAAEYAKAENGYRAVASMLPTENQTKKSQNKI